MYITSTEVAKNCNRDTFIYSHIGIAILGSRIAGSQDLNCFYQF